MESADRLIDVMNGSIQGEPGETLIESRFDIRLRVSPVLQFLSETLTVPIRHSSRSNRCEV